MKRWRDDPYFSSVLGDATFVGQGDACILCPRTNLVLRIPGRTAYSYTLSVIERYGWAR